MPSTYAHYRFGKDVLDRLPAKQKQDIQEHPDLYNVGLHGPDLLFYYKPISHNPINQLGFGIFHPCRKSDYRLSVFRSICFLLPMYFCVILRWIGNVTDTLMRRLQKAVKLITEFMDSAAGKIPYDPLLQYTFGSRLPDDREKIVSSFL